MLLEFEKYSKLCIDPFKTGCLNLCKMSAGSNLPQTKLKITWILPDKDDLQCTGKHCNITFFSVDPIWAGEDVTVTPASLKALIWDKKIIILIININIYSAHVVLHS